MQKETLHAEIMPHNLILEGRGNLRISGVSEVECFDDVHISVVTSVCVLGIHGTDLNIERLSLETGELGVSGRIDRLVYTDEVATGGFWARLFRAP